jgi:hypothetical protein
MVADQLASRHDILAVDIDRLHLVATSPDGALPEARMRAVVTRDLLDLCDVLEQHFFVEEGVVASSALARGGGACISLTSLRGDHRRILGELRHLAAAACDLPIDVLKLRISDALDELGEHERVETATMF